MANKKRHKVEIVCFSLNTQHKAGRLSGVRVEFSDRDEPNDLNTKRPL